MRIQAPRLGVLVVVGTLAGALCAAALVDSDRAKAHCVSAEHHQLLTRNGDEFWNFDYNVEDVNRCNVDWPINFLFRNNANVTKIKNRFENIGYSRRGARMFGRLDDGYGMRWNGDDGIKTFSISDCTFGDMEHLRIYHGDIYGDDMFNLSWGNYVLATSHIDNQECRPDPGPSGQSEEAEKRIAEDARQIWNNERVTRNDIAFANHLDLRLGDDGHILDNSGRGTDVNVP